MRHLDNQNGQALLQVIIASALMGFMMLVFTSMMSSQTRDSRALSEKLVSLDLQNILTAALADGSVCGYVLNNPAILSFDSTAVSPTTPQIINLTNPTPSTAALYSSIVQGPPSVPRASSRASRANRLAAYK